MPRRKKLIETALPLEAINREAAREKSIRHGHPSTLHLWWARRPLAACRAVLFAQLVDDPSSDPQYRVGERVDEERAGAKRAELFNLIEDLVKWENANNPDIINMARAEIARCVASRKIERGDLGQATILFGPEAGTEHPNGPLSTAGVTAYEMVLMRCAPEVVNHFLATAAPPVLDPFAGGGSIPLEAQRLGLRAHASDLNPVPVLINKALIEIPPRFAGRPPVNPEARSEGRSEERGVRSENFSPLTPLSSSLSPRPSRPSLLFPHSYPGARGLAEDVRYYGEWMRAEAEKRIGHLYPKVKITPDMIDAGRKDLEPYRGQELTVIAWLWARTVASPDPSVGGAHVPLVRSFWLSRKKGKEAYIQPVVDRQSGTYEFTVKIGKPVSGFDPDGGTVVRTGATCLITQSPVSFDHIRTAGKSDEMGSRLMAIVCEGTRGRVYISPSPGHEQSADCGLPEEYPITDLPEKALGFRVQRYGIDQHYKLFTPRQLTALTTFSDLVSEARERVLADAQAASDPPNPPYQGGLGGKPLDEGGTGPRAYADAVATYLGFGVSRSSSMWSSNCWWQSNGEFVAQVFTRQAIPMVWDFGEVNIFSSATGNWTSAINWITRVVASLPALHSGTVYQENAQTQTRSDNKIISTDPPYYDNIGYADLSDFFYVWLRRTLKDVYPDLLSTMLTPKAQELIASPYRHEGSKDKAARFFEDGLRDAIGRWCENSHQDYPTTIFYAFKQAETDTQGTASTGWETFLTGIIGNGYSITGTWPMRTERPTGVKVAVNALASSIVLSCVPRAAEAGLATRREFLNALNRELPAAVRTLQAGNIAPVDLAQAAIGPGMAIFSRSAKVMEADGAPMSVRTALALINQVLDEVLAEHEGEFDADTRWAVAWFEQYGLGAGDFGVAETLSKAKNTSVQGLVAAGVVKGRSGTVRLLSREELPADWDPTTDQRLTEWEATHYLIRALDLHGEQAAAALLRTLGSDYGETARALAYRLYHVCERKKWAAEATAYNSLVMAWPEINRLALAGDGNERPVQATLLD